MMDKFSDHSIDEQEFMHNGGDPFGGGGGRPQQNFSFDGYDGSGYDYGGGTSNKSPLNAVRNICMILMYHIRRQKTSHLLMGGGLIVILIGMKSLFSSRDPAINEIVKMLQKNVDTVQIRTGDTQNEVHYLHCKPSLLPLLSSSSAGGKTIIHTDVIMLHAASYNVQEYNKTGIMDDLCSSTIKESGGLVYRISSVTALNLKFNDGPERLEETLQYMKAVDSLLEHPSDVQNYALDKQVSDILAEKYKSKYRTAIVTPSASGKGVVDWLIAGDAQDMEKNYIQKWIPVFPVPALRGPPEELLKLKDEDSNGFSILGVYCDADSNGKSMAESLQAYTGDDITKIVPIPGEHPCYLNHPSDFANAILPFLLS